MTLDVRVRDLRPGDVLRYGRYGHRLMRVRYTDTAPPEWTGDKRRRRMVALESVNASDTLAVYWSASTTIRVEREEPKADAKD